MRMGVERGRKTRKDIKIGICGEHGGEPASVEFCHSLGFSYVSCSPFRVPIATLAAASRGQGEAGQEEVVFTRPQESRPDGPHASGRLVSRRRSSRMELNRGSLV